MKPCPFCAEQIQEAAIKCRHCGSMLTGAASQPMGRSTDERPDELIFDGGPSWKAQLGAHASAILLILGGLLLPIALPASVPIGDRWRLAVGGILAIFGGVWLLVLWVARFVHYRIGTRTIDIESGLLSKRIDTVQLWKVRDIQYFQTLLDRILGLARITVHAQDVSSAQILLWGVPASRAVFDRLKNAIEIARQARNVIGVVT